MAERSNIEVYRECLRNHAASLGSYATDGCGEFTDGTGLQCAACGCHRNFHRKVSYAGAAAAGGREVMEVSAGGDREAAAAMMMRSSSSNKSSSSKRFRTKFTAEQKEKMLGFAEKIGWRLQRKDLEDEIERFCRGVGVTRQVFKVWMHNHKNNTTISTTLSSSANASSLTQ